MKTQPSTIFWIIAVLAILWNLIGVGAFLADTFMRDAMLSEATQEQIDAVYNTPMFISAIYGVATFFGLIGAILLIMRKARAISFFAVSLEAVIIQSLYTILFMDGIAVFGMFQGLIFPLIIIGLDTLFLLYSMRQNKKGVLQ